MKEGRVGEGRERRGRIYDKVRREGTGKTYDNVKVH